MKLCGVFVCNILSDLFNFCVQFGTYPEKFKIADVVPVYKKGSRDELCNHRPISTLPNLTKISEKLICTRLSSFFKQNELLSDNQFGFREGRNTELALLKLIGKIIPYLDAKLHVICVYLDFSSCFDTVPRNELISKLYRYGVRGRSLDFIKSYFTERKQRVHFGGEVSEVLPHELGVVQGSRGGAIILRHLLE